MDLRQKVGQLMMVEIPGKRLTQNIINFIQECHPAGIALFAGNLAGPWHTAKLTADLQAAALEAGDAPFLIGIDQEGGQVSHLRYPCAEMPSNMGRAAAGGPPAAEEAAAVLGWEMARQGINLAFAPVLDVNTNPDNPVIGTRAFSDDQQVVAACGVATINGLHQSAALTMGKHFPGHGDTSFDSHLRQIIVPHGLKRLLEVELYPFIAAIKAGVDSLCSAHVCFTGIDDSGLPATLSPRIMTGLLRHELGFKGVLFSDALVMHAISGGDRRNIPPAAIRAIQAGVDCVMVLGELESQRDCFNALLEAVETGVIPERRLDEAVERILALRKRVLVPELYPAWPDGGHQSAAQRLSRQAVTVVRDEKALLPLTGERIGIIEFASGSFSPVETSRNEPLGNSTLADLLTRRHPGARVLAIQSDAPGAGEVIDHFVLDCDRLIIATRSAVLDPLQTALLHQAAAADKPTVQLALRSPYDANLAPEIGTVLLTYGDQPGGIAGVVDILLGNAQASGRLPITLKPSLPASRA